jgi:heme-degrading monooxygenase HmoA
MIQLKIDLSVRAGNESKLEQTFREVFIPAISVQEGFDRVALLRQADSESKYMIQLSFETEEQRRRWVASDEHQNAYPKISALCAQTEAVRYDIVASTVK